MNYSYAGFYNVGNWWEPDVDHLIALLLEAHNDDGTYRSFVVKWCTARPLQVFLAHHQPCYPGGAGSGRRA